MVHGLQPGPLLFEKNPLLIAGLYGGLFIANIFLLILGLFAPGTSSGAQPAGIRSQRSRSLLLYSGSFFFREQHFRRSPDADLRFLWIFHGQTEVSNYPLVLGYVLGPIVEENLRRALIVYAGDLTQFFTRPISGVLLVLALLTLLSPFYQKKLQKFLNRPTTKS